MGDRDPAGDPGDLADGDLYRHLRSEIEELLPVPRPASSPSMSSATAWPGFSTWACWSTSAGPIAWPAGRDFSMTSRPASARYPQTDVSDVRTGFATERAFVENHAAALLDLEDLRTIRQRIEDRLHWEYGKETGTLLDDTEPAPPLDFSDVEKKYSDRAGRLRPGGDALLQQEDGCHADAGRGRRVLDQRGAVGGADRARARRHEGAGRDRPVRARACGSASPATSPSRPRRPPRWSTI